MNAVLFSLLSCHDAKGQSDPVSHERQSIRQDDSRAQRFIQVSDTDHFSIQGSANRS